MKLKKKLIVIACITLVIIASVDAAENDASEKKAAQKKKKKVKAKKVKNVQGDDAQVQNQQPNYPEYPENYDYDNDYEEPENGGTGKRIPPLPVSHSQDLVAEVEKASNMWNFLGSYHCTHWSRVYFLNEGYQSRFLQNLTYFYFILAPA